MIAGPGAGKSFSLMRRIARLLEQGVEPEKILLVTFTRTAAQDLRSDLQKLNVEGVERVNAGTLHSFCFRMLKREAVLEITGRNARPIFGFEKDVLVKDLSKLSGNVGKRAIEKRVNAFEAAWSRLQHEAAGWPTDPTDRAFHQLLIGYLKFHRAMLIGEVIPEALKYLRQNPGAEELNKYDYVFVDEYQDLNKAEQELINLLGSHGRLMVIGDEDQSIYQSFRHANPEGIRQFHVSHPTTQDYPLDECRRCPQRVVRIADAFIQNNQNREVRHLMPRPTNGEGIVSSVQWPDFKMETLGIAEFIRDKVSKGTNPGNILVLCPRRTIGYDLKERLMSVGVEAHSFFTEELFDSSEIREAMCLLNLLVNPEDRVSLRVWLSFGTTTLNTPAYLRLYAYCKQTGESPLRALHRLVDGSLKIPYTKPIVERFKVLIATLQNLENKSPLEVRDILFPDGHEWTNDVRAMLAGVQEDGAFTDMLQIINSSVINPEPPLIVDYVRVMSLHKSKGLTAEVVIICGMVEGLIPRYQEETETEDAQLLLEEQRRLFFVGITRPTSELIVSTVARIPKNLGYQLGMTVPNSESLDMPAIASSFLSELGPDFPNAILGEHWISASQPQA